MTPAVVEPIRTDKKQRSVPRSRAESFPCNYMYRTANRGSPYRQLGHFGSPFNDLSRLIRISSTRPSFLHYLFYERGRVEFTRVRFESNNSQGVSFMTVKENVMTRLHNSENKYLQCCVNLAVKFRRIFYLIAAAIISWIIEKRNYLALIMQY